MAREPKRIDYPGESPFNRVNHPDSVLRHPHFLLYLKYFLFGPDLPHETMDRFRQAVADCGNITSGDIGPLCELARSLARQQRAGRDLADEFFKLALECGLDPSDAREVRDSVKRINSVKRIR